MTFDRHATDEISPKLYDFLHEAGLTRVPEGESLFHYTSGEGLRGIMSDGVIFATDPRFFSDPTEFEYGRQLLQRPLDRLSHAGLDAVRQQIDASLARRGGWRVFVCCFCEVDDLLSQWHGYGARGAGYSIGVPWQELSRNGSVILVGSLYGDQAVINAAERVIGMGITRFMAASTDSDQEADVDALTCLLVTALLVAICGKNRAFAAEREFRLVHLIDGDIPNSADMVEFRLARGLIAPYVRLPMPRCGEGHLAISSVRCGPSLKDDAAEAGLRLLLSKCNLPLVPALRSDVPLRSPD